MTPLEPQVDGDRLSLEVSSPHTWKLGVVVILVLLGAIAFARNLFGPDDVATVVEILLVGPMLLFFHRHGVVLDRRAGTVTTWNRLLFIISWKSVAPTEGHTIEVQRDLVMPEEGESYWVGRVFLGPTKLFVKAEAQAQAAAELIAEFLGVPCTQRQSAPGEAQRAAAMPMFITLGLTALFLAAFGIYRLVGR